MTRDHRGIDIQRVGVKEVHLPFLIRTKAGGHQTVLGNVTLAADLPRNFKGTHMSRFIEILTEWSQRPITGPEMKAILRQVMDRLEARSAHISLNFKYFIEKSAPVSGLNSFLDYDCTFEGDLGPSGFDFLMSVQMPVTSLCPCSKEIAAYGAHNQRGRIHVRLRHRGDDFIWIEDLVGMLEEQGSCEIYPLLKREDEKYVTERAYNNPKFVEDILRDCIVALRADRRVRWFEIECENYESIHNHSAYAYHREPE